jgi:clan AA aspartic protease
MIWGRVTAARQVIIPLQIRGPDGRSESIEAIVDTGFDGLLTLPPDLVAKLELPYGMTRSYELGHGGNVEFDVHRATVVWDGQEREVSVVVSRGGALVGMALLEGFRLFADVVEGGEVRIEACS